MADMNPELERELLRTLRTARTMMWTLGILVGAGILVGLIGLVLALVSRAGSGDGVDVHAPLRPGAHASVTTEDGLRVEATIIDWWEGEGGPNVVVKVDGMPVSAERWFFYLEDDSRLALASEAQPDGGTRLFLAQGPPEGGSVRFVHFNPDDSHGDIYFDLP